MPGAAASWRLRLRGGAEGRAERAVGSALRDFWGVGAAPLSPSRGAARSWKEGSRIWAAAGLGVRGVPTRKGHPEEFGGTSGAHFALLSLKFRLPASPALERGFWKLLASPSSRCRGSFAVIGKN